MKTAKLICLLLLSIPASGWATGHLRHATAPWESDLFYCLSQDGKTQVEGKRHKAANSNNQIKVKVIVNFAHFRTLAIESELIGEVIELKDLEDVTAEIYGYTRSKDTAIIVTETSGILTNNGKEIALECERF